MEDGACKDGEHISRSCRQKQDGGNQKRKKKADGEEMGDVALVLLWCFKAGDATKKKDIPKY